MLKFQTVALTSGVVTTILTGIAPAQALQVQVKPDNPKLGETISVVVTTTSPNSQPQVSSKSKNYPVFPLGSNRYRTLIPTTPLDQPGRLEIKVSGDGEVSNLAVGLGGRNFPTQSIRVKGGGNGATQIELDRIADFKTIVSPKKFWNGPFLRPSSGSVSSVFGVRRYYNGVLAKDYYHRGVDYAAATGSVVVAPAAGKVALVGRESAGFRVNGNTVGMDHGQGVLSAFLHLHTIEVQEGDFVQAGQRIGTVGSTGASTGPHLHWGLYIHGLAVDPVPWRFAGIE